MRHAHQSTLITLRGISLVVVAFACLVIATGLVVPADSGNQDASGPEIHVYSPTLVVGEASMMGIELVATDDWQEPTGALVVESETLAIEPARLPVVWPVSADRHTFAVRATAGKPGPHELIVRIEDETGEPVRSETESVRAATADDIVTLDATFDADEGETLEITITNEAGVWVVPADVIVTDEHGSLIWRTSLYTIPPDDNRSVTFSLGPVDASTLDVTAYYGVGGESETSNTTVEYRDAEIELDDLEIRQGDDESRIVGVVENVGGTPAEQVVVRVVPEEGVGPVLPGWETTLEDLRPGDRTGFSVSAVIDSEVDSVSLVARYRTGDSWDRTMATVDASDRFEDDPVGENRSVSTPAGSAAVDGDHDDTGRDRQADADESVDDDEQGEVDGSTDVDGGTDEQGDDAADAEGQAAGWLTGSLDSVLRLLALSIWTLLIGYALWERLRGGLSGFRE